MRRTLRLRFVVPTVLAALAVTGLQLVTPRGLPAAEAAIGGAWGSASSLSLSGRNASEQNLAMSADGTTAVAVWKRSNGTYTIIQAATATVSGRDAFWSAPVDLSVTGGNGSLPQVRISSDGSRATAIWLRTSYSPNVAVVQTASATIADGAASWSSTTNLSDTSRTSNFPRVALSAGGGTMVAVWQESATPVNVMRAATGTVTDSGPAWNTPTTVGLAGGYPGYLQVEMSAGGSTVAAVWGNQNAGNIIQAASASLDSGVLSWSDAATSLTDSEGAYPQLRLSADGTRATALFMRGSSNQVIQSASATVDGASNTWTETTTISATGTVMREPTLAASADGSVVVAGWTRTAYPPTVQVATATFDGSTATWSTPANLSTPGFGAYEAQVAVSANGAKALATWAGWNGSKDVIQSSSALIAGGVGDWSLGVNASPTTQNSMTPSVALSANGLNATVLWKVSDSPTVVQSASGVLGPLSSPTVAPTVVGAVKVGQLVGVDRGTWTGSPTYAYQWQRCDADGLNCANIAGATALTYTVVNADASGTLRAKVFATGTYGTGVAATAARSVGSPPLDDWTAPTNVTDGSVGAQWPVMALSTDGSKAVAVWRYTTGQIGAATATVTGTTMTWSTPQLLSAAGQDADSPTVSLSANGDTAVATWRRSDGSHYIAQASVGSIAEGVATWSNPADLSASGRHAYSPAVALSADGRQAVASWSRPNGTNEVVQVVTGSVRDGAATWTTPLQIALNGWNSFYPKPTISADGTTAVLAWRRGDAGSGNRVQAAGASINVDTNTATWSTPAWVSPSGGEDAQYTSLALSRDGSTAISMWSQTGIVQSAVASITDGVPAWAEPIDLATTADAGQAALSHDGTRATAIWVDYAPGVPGSVVRAVSGTIEGNVADWSTPTDLSFVGDNPGGLQVRVSADGGRATAAWNQGAVSATTSATVTGKDADWWLPRAFVGGAWLSLDDSGTRAAVALSESSIVKASYGIVTPDPVLLEDPSISGHPATGRTLTADPGTWSGSPTFSYQWRRCDAGGGSCVDVGSDQATYALGVADLDSRIKVLITATRSSMQTGHAASDLTDVIVEPPANTYPPQVTGTARVGQFLTATPGTWTGDPAPTLTYQWQRCTSMGACSDIEVNATFSTYTVAANDAGFTLRVVVTGTNSGDSASAASLPSATVTSGSGGGGGGGGGGTLAVNSGAPTISGSESVGQTLTASPGTWSGTPTFTYQWQRCDAELLTCAAIATVSAGATYTLTTADAGSRIRVVVTATTAGGAATAYSAATGAIGGLPALAVRIPGVETVHVYSQIKLRTSAHVKRWRIDFSRPIFQKGVGKVSVIRGTGTPPDAITVGWYNGRKVTLSVKVVTKSGLVLTRTKLVNPVVA